MSYVKHADASTFSWTGPIFGQRPVRVTPRAAALVPSWQGTRDVQFHCALGVEARPRRQNVMRLDNMDLATDADQRMRAVAPIQLSGSASFSDKRTVPSPPR